MLLKEKQISSTQKRQVREQETWIALQKLTETLDWLTQRFYIGDEVLKNLNHLAN